MDEAHALLLDRLLAERTPHGAWEGGLTSSALSTALAVSALAAPRRVKDEPDDAARVAAGTRWLLTTQGADGGWGDTPGGRPNLPTTAIAWAALRRFCAELEGVPQAVERAVSWLRLRVGSTDARQLAEAVEKTYGRDHTFAAPILAHLAWCGVLGDPKTAWRHVPPLPFPLALLPRSLLPRLNLRVVSYALPALIAIGLARHVNLSRARGASAWGEALAPALLRRLGAIQPVHGGFLDAAPLTAFTALGLASAGWPDDPVARRCRDFLRSGMRDDGSWPIDTNLAVWVTSLAVQACLIKPRQAGSAGFDRARLVEWLRRCQHRVPHPFTGARAGGWAWTDAAGGVPDADDTAAALIALRQLGAPGDESVRDGLRWLLDLQNRDGGVPTFCRGWGRLPFDRSCPDITAHALAAWLAWETQLDGDLARRTRRAEARALRYLADAQRDDGSWHPLWFGNDGRADQANPTVGTARVCVALADARGRDARADAAGVRGEQWLLNAQSADGAWGAGEGTAGTVEETAWAVTALARGRAGASLQAARRGGAWLANRVHQAALEPAPIGLYFARLWYGERLYPLIWSVEALARLSSTP